MKLTGIVLYKIKPFTQYLIATLSVVLVLLGTYALGSLIDYKMVAFLLLVTVSVNAIFLNLRPVLLAAALSALAWNYFFIPPKFTFAITGTEDTIMFIMYFLIALVNGALTYKIRQIEKEANKREEKENTLKLYNTLINSLSHELRTPIATIIGATDNLVTMNDKLSEENKFQLLQEISKASLTLNRQVGNLLNMSRLESGVIQPRNDWFDVNELVYDVLAQLKDQLNNKPVHVAIKENLPLFKLDYGLVFQVLHNLVHNAATYIPTYAIITVRASCRENKLCLVVEDTGNGFPPGEIEQVFEKFYRLKNASPGGTGLGLSIVKGFVEAMHGKILLQNREDGPGAKFTVEIPCELSYVSPLES